MSYAICKQYIASASVLDVERACCVSSCALGFAAQRSRMLGYDHYRSLVHQTREQPSYGRQIPATFAIMLFRASVVLEFKTTRIRRRERFWQNEAARAYGVSSIPHALLVDQNGTIAATHLRGPALAAKLNELLR